MRYYTGKKEERLMVTGSNFPVLYDFILCDAWQKKSEIVCIISWCIFFLQFLYTFPLKNQWHLQEMFNSEKRWMDGFVIVPLCFLSVCTGLLSRSCSTSSSSLDSRQTSRRPPRPLPRQRPPLRPWQEQTPPSTRSTPPSRSLTTTPHSGTSLLQTLVFTIYSK